MKKLVLVILSLVSTLTFAQTSLDNLVLTELNRYRQSKGLKPATLDPSAYRAANHHTLWMSKVGYTTMNQIMSYGNSEGYDSHYETVDVPSFTEIFSPDDRASKFIPLKNLESLSEICNMARATDASNPIVVKNLSEAQLAKGIIEKFSQSPEHEEELRQPGSTVKAGVSVIVKDGIAYTTIFFFSL